MYKILRRLKKKIKKVILLPVKIYFFFVKSKFECNICGFKSNNFTSDGWHKNSQCPYCWSQVRQRLLLAALNTLQDVSFDSIVKEKRILHFAPEDGLKKFLKNGSSLYKTADFLSPWYFYSEIDFDIDISDMPSISDNSFDCVIACDVLEHVENDSLAIKEVYRILDYGGCCIFTVPQKDDLLTTYEDDKIKTPEERKEKFGQQDHMRIYGQDFQDKLEKNWFIVSVIDSTFFDKKKIERNILAPQIFSTNPLATNHRKIFFGKKRP